MDWKDQYKHPLWQKKRLEALEAAEYACQCCFDGESQLQVHHKRYVKGRKIWEYETAELSVLCASCHEVTHAVKDVFNNVISLIPADGYTEIVGMLASYCNNVSGPAHAECEHEIWEINDPYSDAIGRIAAAFANLFIGVPALIEIVEKIESHNRNDEITIVIKRQNTYGMPDD